ncbi:MAG: hypothetical protein NTX66_03790 [Candidatus Falkowbacteria bacterium]|nr:hypothetical protein [Candidatus Falkowbacteria bacterium]
MKEGEQFSLMPELDQAGFVGDEEPKKNKESVNAAAEETGSLETKPISGDKPKSATSPFLERLAADLERKKQAALKAEAAEEEEKQKITSAYWAKVYSGSSGQAKSEGSGGGLRSEAPKSEAPKSETPQSEAPQSEASKDVKKNNKDRKKLISPTSEIPKSESKPPETSQTAATNEYESPYEDIYPFSKNFRKKKGV